MKKGCLIVLGVFLALIGLAVVGAFVAYKRMDPEFGLSVAPKISHEKFVSAATKVRAVLNPEGLVKVILPLVPKEAFAQARYSGDPAMILSMVLPREIAILATPDFKTGKTDITFFVNEMRGGPFMAKMANETNALKSFPYIKWADKGVEAPERGVVQLTGSLPIPETVETKILENWKNGPPSEQLKLDGTHQLEALMDNRNGDILTLLASFMNASGGNYEDLLAGSQGQMALTLLPGIHDIRLTADMTDADTVKALLRIDSTKEQGPTLMFVVSAAWMEAVSRAQEQGLTLKGEPVWDEEKGAIVVDMTITGTKALLEKKLAAMAPTGVSAPAPAAEK